MKVSETPEKSPMTGKDPGVSSNNYKSYGDVITIYNLCGTRPDGMEWMLGPTWYCDDCKKKREIDPNWDGCHRYRPFEYFRGEPE